MYISITWNYGSAGIFWGRVFFEEIRYFRFGNCLTIFLTSFWWVLTKFLGEVFWRVYWRNFWWVFRWFLWQVIGCFGLWHFQCCFNSANFVPSTIGPHLRMWFLLMQMSSYRAWVSTGTKGAWHPWNFWTVMSGTRWFWQFYYIMLCFTLEFWGFTSEWHPLVQIPNSSPVSNRKSLFITKIDNYST